MGFFLSFLRFYFIAAGVFELTPATLCLIGKVPEAQHFFKWVGYNKATMKVFENQTILNLYATFVLMLATTRILWALFPRERSISLANCIIHLLEAAFFARDFNTSAFTKVGPSLHPMDVFVAVCVFFCQTLFPILYLSLTTFHSEKEKKPVENKEEKKEETKKKKNQ